MSEVTVTINKRSYQISCDDGQEDHLRGLARDVDKRVVELVAGMGQIGDQRLLVMAGLLLADEVNEANAEIEGLNAATQQSDVMSAPEASLTAGIDALSARIEALAEELEQA